MVKQDVGGEVVEQKNGGEVFDPAHLFLFNQCSGSVLGQFDQGGSVVGTESPKRPAIGGMT